MPRTEIKRSRTFIMAKDFEGKPTQTGYYIDTRDGEPAVFNNDAAGIRVSFLRKGGGNILSLSDAKYYRRAKAREIDEIMDSI